MNKHTVFVVDDDVELCHSLQWLLESVGLVPKIYNSSLDFLADFKRSPTNGCLLLDIRMPEMSGLELQEQLNLAPHALPIIFMTGHGDVPMAVRAMKAGAFDFLTKPFNDQTLLEQIHKAIAHQKELNISHKRSLLIQARLKLLTTREIEILKLIIEGKLNKEISFDLNISIKTVELHRAHIMEKMQAATVAELVKFYLLANPQKT
jgi:FixJ family two-component response regulator